MAFTRDEFIKEAECGSERVVLYREVGGDMDTPVSLLLKVAGDRRCFLLESANIKKVYSRFSFLGFDVESEYVIRDDGLYLDGRHVGDLGEIERFLSENRTVSVSEWNFAGGLVGYFAFEFVDKTPVLKKPLSKKHDTLAKLFLVERFLVYDNYTNRLYLGVSKKVDHFSCDFGFSEAKSELDLLESELFKRRGFLEPVAVGPRVVDMGFSKREFEKTVSYVRELIGCGEAIQVVVSNFYDILGIDPFEFYRALRRLNPSPYMYFFKDGDEFVVGSSPEIHVRKRGDRITIKPIAGTRPRGATEEELTRFREELISDEKERAEHLMLVDLARNDLSSVCRIGSLEVSSFMDIEEYSHVIHLVSEVNALLGDGFSEIDLLKNTFPAGTLSGAPKSRAVEIIDEVEREVRSCYGGCIGYIGFNGDMDMAITIRTAVFRQGVARFQAGAGIIYDSDPEREYYETINKLAALARAGGVDDSIDR